MTLTDYQDAIDRFDPTPDVPLEFYCLGLGGETGEVLDLIKKSSRHHLWTERNGVGRPLDHDILGLELGDVLWYVARMAKKAGFTLDTIAAMNIQKLDARARRIAAEGHPAEAR